jgi:hypothetical protein
MKRNKQGQKICRHCDEVIGAKSYSCKHCGGDVRKPSAVIIVDGQEITETPNTRRVFCLPDGFIPPDDIKLKVVGVPMGEPVVKLRHSDDGSFPDSDTIMDWCMTIREKELNNGRYVTNEGLLRYARQQVNKDLRYNNKGPEMTDLVTLIKGLPDIQYSEVPINSDTYQE